VKFSNRNQQALLKIATGEGKLPAQTMEGKYKNISPEEAYKRVTELLNDPEWIQVGVDPTRHGYFYDRANAMPVSSADELIQIGNFVLAKNAQYDSKENYLYEKVGAEPQTDTPAFKRWFGDSKVVDKDGNPVVVYHGTDSKFKKFNTEEGAFFFGGWEAESFAKTYGKNVVPAYVRITNPFKASFEEFISYDIDDLKSKGYDGVVYEEKVEGMPDEITQQWVAFEPNQVKSATSNKGTFSPEREEIDEEFTAPIAMAKAKEMLQKRKPIPMGAFADVDPKLVQLAQPVFYPQQKTIIDRIEGLRDNFWKKTAQGIADQFRAIKDYSEEGYMQARLSKTVDGAL
jgi:hypothetical protein